jgi:DNA-directed RNA polymerase
MNNYATPDNNIIKSNPKIIKNSQISKKQITCINYMNNVPFTINKKVLHYLEIEWDKEDSTLFKGFNKIHPKTELVKDKKMDKSLLKIIQAHNSMHFYYSNTLMMADLYKDQVFYIPTFLDFRGRLYSKVSYLSYQGGDMARALIQFYSPDEKISNFKLLNKKDSPLGYIKEYAGNVYNLSKQPIKVKRKWCTEFIEVLKKEFKIYYKPTDPKFNSKEEIALSETTESDDKRVVESSFETALKKTALDFDFYFLNKYLDNADEPFQFISVYFALKSVIIYKESNINIPILFDASCSGVQHLASITYDLDVAKMVNVISSPEVKNDFYQIAADYVVHYIQTNPDLTDEIKEKLNLIKITRSILKLPIMTISYNIGLSKMSKELQNKMGKLVEIDDNLIVTEKEKGFDDTNLSIDSQELRADSLDLKALSEEKEQNLENSSGNKTLKFKINKEHSKTNEDLFLSPKE